MKAFILAAGKGTRLAPLTDDIPKCLVKLGDTSLLERQLNVLIQGGVSDITILTGYHANEIERLGYQTVHNQDYAETNMVATLFCARDVFTDETDMLISYGDIVFEPRVLEALKKCTAPMCVITDQEWERLWATRMADPLQDAETLKLDAEGYIQELGKKPKNRDEVQGQYIGMIKVRADYVPKLLEVYDAMDQESMYDGKNFPNMFMTSFLQYLIDIDWPVKSVAINNGWLEVDTVEDLELYAAMLQDGRLQKFYNVNL